MGATLYWGLRLPTVTYLYDDPEHPDRVTGAVQSPPYTEEDRALLSALDAYERSVCPGCHQPISVAWHSEMEGWFEAERYVCHACTARREDDEQVSYTITRNTRPSDRPMPPFELGVTTVTP